MSGLLALLDDVAAIAKIAAASIDDVAANAVKAGTKTLGVVIDDAAVTPNYVVGITAARELPMIWRIALGSLKNKALLIPGLLILDYFLPIAIVALLMLGGAYLCFEGAERVLKKLLHAHGDDAAEDNNPDPTALEKQRVAGAIKTDLILSAEIMTLALSLIESDSIWIAIATLVVVGLLVTFLVYGVVAIIVKLDDFGVYLARTGRTEFVRQFGHWIVRAVPKLLLVLTIIGTAAMLWVGGSIFIHSLHEFGLHEPFASITGFAGQVAAMVPEQLSGFTNWFVTAACDGVFGLILGSIIAIAMEKIIHPMFSAKSH